VEPGNSTHSSNASEALLKILDPIEPGEEVGRAPIDMFPALRTLFSML